MLHAKFQDHRTFGSGEEYFLICYHIYGHGGHLGHVTNTILINLCPLLLSKEDPHKICLLLTNRFQRRIYSNVMTIYMYIDQRQGYTTPWGYLTLLSVCSFAASFQLTDLVTVSPGNQS